jgi:hypothetical protein
MDWVDQRREAEFLEKPIPVRRNYRRKPWNIWEFHGHKAPGEAKAEFAEVQKLCVVDAIWTDDGDVWMHK